MKSSGDFWCLTLLQLPVWKEHLLTFVNETPDPLCSLSTLPNAPDNFKLLGFGLILNCFSNALVWLMSRRASMSLLLSYTWCYILQEATVWTTRLDSCSKYQSIQRLRFMYIDSKDELSYNLLLANFLLAALSSRLMNWADRHPCSKAPSIDARQPWAQSPEAKKTLPWRLWSSSWYLDIYPGCHHAGPPWEKGSELQLWKSCNC